MILYLEQFKGLLDDSLPGTAQGTLESSPLGAESTLKNIPHVY